MKTSRRIVSTVVAVASCATATADIYGPDNYQDPAWAPAWYSSVTAEKVWAEWLNFPDPVDGVIAPTNYGWNFPIGPGGTQDISFSSDTGTSYFEYREYTNGKVSFDTNVFNHADPYATKYLTIMWDMRKVGDDWINSDLDAIKAGLRARVGLEFYGVETISVTPKWPDLGDWASFSATIQIFPQPAREKIIWDFKLSGSVGRVQVRTVRIGTACPAPGSIALAAFASVALCTRRR
jgi:hypothetical protein